jgi:hypothetical protein
MPDHLPSFLSALLALAFPVFAQDPGRPVPRKGEGLPIMFLPPPMKGTISLGIYNRAGKLVRILHREAGESEFQVGENGLLTRWDGCDDAGQILPPGKYTASGWMVGDLGVEGVAFHGNDWIKDESPRYQRVTEVKNVGRDQVRVTLRTVDGKDETLGWNLSQEGVAPPKIEIEGVIDDGQLVIRKGEAKQPVMLGEGAKALSAVAGSGARVWTIVETPGGREVRAYSAQGEFLRRLAYQKGEPQPRQIAASQWSEMIFLLEENATEQRLRSLTLGAPGPPALKPAGAEPQPASMTAWRVTYLRRVVNSESFDAVAGQLGREKPPGAEQLAAIQTRLNPLLGSKRQDVQVKVAADAEGALLKLSDDLPLTHLTSTANLKWVALVKEGATLVLFQGDGGVVEEFKITRPNNMMSFEAGEYELKPSGVKPGQPGEKSGTSPQRSKPLRPGDDL